jgi:hypothetical protein
MSTPIKFGTDGWRGRIAEDYTVWSMAAHLDRTPSANPENRSTYVHPPLGERTPCCVVAVVICHCDAK